MPLTPGADRRARRCVVCQQALAGGATLFAAADDAYPTCHAVACRMVVSRRADMGEANFRHYLQMQARHRLQLAAATAASVARERAEAEENANGWAALRARVAGDLTPAPLELLLPSGPQRSRPLSATRRERYRAHLLGIIAEASVIDRAAPGDSAAGPDAADVDADAGSTLAGRLCGWCGGGCCTYGGDQAYLSAATMRRFMDAQPQLSAAEVAAAYLDRLAGSTQAKSCINHTARGCSLPREMRSTICNRFSCVSLARLQAAQRGARAQPAQQMDQAGQADQMDQVEQAHPVEQAVPMVHVILVVRRKQDHWRRAEPDRDNAVNAYAVLRETGVQRISLRAASPSAAAAAASATD